MSDEDRSKQPQAPSGGLTLDNVWKAFDLRVAMLEALAENALPAANGSGKAPASMELPPVTEPDEPPSNSVPPAPVTQTPKASPPAGANPMSMFAVPKNKTEAPNAPPPPAEKTEPPPEKSSAKDEKNAPAQNNPQGNPMSFFTEKPKNDDESS